MSGPSNSFVALGVNKGFPPGGTAWVVVRRSLVRVVAYVRVSTEEQAFFRRREKYSHNAGRAPARQHGAASREGVPAGGVRGRHHGPRGGPHEAASELLRIPRARVLVLGKRSGDFPRPVGGLSRSEQYARGTVELKGPVASLRSCARPRGGDPVGCRKIGSTTVAGDLPTDATVTRAAVMAEVHREHAWFGGRRPVRRARRPPR